MMPREPLTILHVPAFVNKVCGFGFKEWGFFQVISQPSQVIQYLFNYGCPLLASQGSTLQGSVQWGLP